MNFAFFLRVLALVLLILAGVGIPGSGRFALGWLGLAAWLGSELAG